MRFNLGRLTPVVEKISGGLAKAGKAAADVIKDRNFQRGLVAAIPPTLTAFYYIKKYQKEVAEKEELYKKAAAKHNAIIKELNTKIEISQERQDKLLAYDTRIKSEMAGYQAEIQRLKEQIAELEKKKDKNE